VSKMNPEFLDCYQFQTSWIRWWCPDPLLPPLLRPIDDPVRIVVQGWIWT
jgi:hypothetical protein